MSTPPYGSWNHPSRAGRPSTADSPNQSDHPSYPGSPYATSTYGAITSSPLSTGSTSSLTGAISDPSMSQRHNWANTTQAQAQLQAMSITGHPPTFSTIATGHTNLPFPAVPQQGAIDGLNYEGYTSTGPSIDTYGDYYQHPRSSSSSASGSSSSFPRRVSPPTAEGTLESEVNALRRTKQALEYECQALKQELQRLQTQRAHVLRSSSSSASTSSSSSPHTTPPTSANFQRAWQARTDARIRYLCSPNRAGNALCAWHDSRRERRAFPPRNAPEGYLNCGCTIEEALFEESLARHNVGSYHPGENVRMDPALRNPLLKLLQTRYGYRDGDFERDSRTGEWMEGEGPAVWEQRAQMGPPRRRATTGSDNDRH